MPTLTSPLVLSVRFLIIFMQLIDRDKTVLRRFKPNSCSFLIGEQPNPLNRLQLKNKKSRHRGAKHSHRSGL